MNDIQERRSKYFEDKEKAVTVHEERAFEYEKLAIRYTNSAFKLLTYLNGGALVALPAAIALLNSSAADHKRQIVITAAFFVAGLVAVLISQLCAFFTMARRAEAQQFLASQQSWHASATHYPEQFDYKDAKSKADAEGAKAAKKFGASDKVRLAGLAFAWCSAVAFMAGCIYAAWNLS